LRNLIRWSIDFYASRYRARVLRQKERERATEPPTRKLDRLRATLEEHESSIPTPAYRALKRDVDDYSKAAAAEEDYRESSAALLAPLATAGMGALALSGHSLVAALSCHSIGIRISILTFSTFLEM
jgi:hypothetical protein